MTEVICVLDAKAELGECPVWSADEQALYWVDIYAPSMNRLDPATGENRNWIAIRNSRVRSMPTLGLAWVFVPMFPNRRVRGVPPADPVSLVDVDAGAAHRP